MVIVLDDYYVYYYTALHLGSSFFCKLQALAMLIGFLELNAIRFVARLVSSSLYLFDTIVELHAMDQNDRFHWKKKRDLICNKSYSIHNIHVVYVVESFITLN